MNTKAILFLMLAALSVIAVILVTRSYLTGATQTAQTAARQTIQNPEVKVLVAKRDLKIGTLLSADDYGWQSWPERGVNEAYFKAADDITALNGQVVRFPVASGEPIRRTSLVAQGTRGFLAAALAPGMRAATVQVSPTAGVGGFVFAGDRVDVILSHELPTGQQAAETVLQNVRVLGIDQRSTRDDQTARLFKTVTLEVTPKMAEKLAILPRLGSLSLALRSLARSEGALAGDVDSPPVDKAASHTWGAEVSGLLENPDDTMSTRNQVRVSRGNEVSVVEFQSPIKAGSTAKEGDNR